MGYRGRTAGLITAVLALAASCLFTGLSSVCRAQEKSPGQTILERVDFVDADLQQVVNAIKQQTGIEIGIEPSDKPYKRITLSLENRPLDFVLARLCDLAGAALRIDNGVYIITPRDSAAPVKPAPTPSPEPEAPAPKRALRTEKIRLQNTRPSEVLRYLGIEQGMINDLAANSIYQQFTDRANPYLNAENRYLTPSLKPLGDQPLQSLTTPRVPPVVPTASEAQAAPQDDRSVAPGAEQGQGFGGIGGFGGGGQFGRGGGGGGIGGFGGGGQGGIGGRGGGFGGQGGAGGGAGQLLPEGLETAIGYDLDNSIIARGTDESIRELKNLLNLLDIAPKQIQIRAEFVTVSQNDLNTFGIDWQVARGNLQAGTTGFAGGPVFLNYATGNVVAALRATLTEGKARLMNAPMVTTLNNVPVSITIGRQVPVFVTSPVAAGNGTVVLQTALIPVPVFSGLQVWPRINGDDSVSMYVAPFLNDIVDTVTGPDGTTAPVISTQYIAVNRRIRNDETMVIGGLISKNDQNSIRRVPLFSDLPLIGQLFRSTSTTIADSELLIFVTPHIIRDTPTTGPVPGGGGVAP